jgi:hypothetical protein
MFTDEVQFETKGKKKKVAEPMALGINGYFEFLYFCPNYVSILLRMYVHIHTYVTA